MAKYDGSLLFDTKIDDKGFRKGIGNLKSQIGKAAKVMTAALVGIGAASIKVGSDFNKSMSEVAAISGATGKDLDKLRSAAEEMGATTKFSASESAEALKYMAMAGWDTEQMLSGLPGVIYLAAASGEELALVSDIVTDALSAFGMEAGQAAEFADLLASASSNSNTNVSMLGESFKYVAPVAGALGYTAEDTALALGLMANAGIKGSQAGTALRNVLTRMAKPTKDVQFAMDELGISMTDANGEMIPFEEQMIKIREAMATMEPEEQARIAAMLAGQQGMSGLLAIANASEEEFNKLTQATREYNGAAEEMAAIMQDNLSGDLTILKSALEGLGIAISELVDGSLRNAVQGFTEFIDAIALAIKGPEALRESFESTNEVLNEMPDRMLAIEEHMEGMSFGVEGLSEVIQEFLIQALTDLKELFPELVEEGTNFILHLMEGLEESIPLMAETMLEIQMSLMESFLELAPGFIVLGLEYVSNLMLGFSEKLPELIPLAQEAISTILDGLIENAPQMLAAGIQIIAQIGMGIAESIPKLITSGLDIIIGLGDAIIQNLPQIFEAGIEIVIAIAQGIAENLPKIIEEAPRLINEFASAIYNALPQILLAGIKIIATLLEGLIQAIPTLVANIPQIIQAIINVFTLTNWAKVGKDLIAKIAQGITGMKGNILQTITKLAKSMIEGFINWFKKGTTAGSGLIRNLINGIKSVASGLLSTVGSLAKDALSSLIDAFLEAPNIGKNLVKGLWNGIGNMAGWILDKIKGFGKTIMDGFKSVFGIKSPSREMRDEIGVWIPRGIAEGIEKTTPELRDVTEEEMDKLISDYKMYGRDAIQGFGELSAEEMAKLKEQHKEDGAALSEAIAEGIESKVDRVEEAMNKIRQATVSELDRLGDAIMTALERQYKEQEEKEVNHLEKELKLLQDSHKKKIDELKSNSKALQKRREADAESRYKTLDAIIKEEEEVFKEKETLLKEEIDIVKDQYKELMKSENLQAEARYLALQENNTELVELLETYYPDWLDAGQSFGESLLDGLNSMKKPIQDEVNEILSMVSTAEAANARIIQAKLDYEEALARGDTKGMEEAHKRAERYRSQGGNIGVDDALHLKNYRNQLDKQLAAEQAKMNAANNDISTKGVVQNINIVSPTNTPSENARLLKRKQEELLRGY